MPDRLNSKYESYEFEEEILEKPKLEKTDKIKIDKSERFVFSDERLIIPEKDIKLEDGDLSDKNDKFENRSENSEKYVKHSMNVKLKI